MKKKIFTLMTLALLSIGSAWADKAISCSAYLSGTAGTPTVTDCTLEYYGSDGSAASAVVAGTQFGTTSYYYAKMNNDANFYEIALNKTVEGTDYKKFKAGDVITVYLYSNAATVAYKIGKTAATDVSKTKQTKSQIIEVPHTLTAAEIESNGKVRIYRNSSNTYFAGVSVAGTRPDVELMPANLTLTSEAKVTLGIGSTSTVTTTSDSDADKTYTSADTNVATVSAEGVITAVAGGRTTVTVSQAETATYDAALVSIEVIVPYVANLESTQYTAGSNKYKFSDSDNIYYFDNGLIMSNNGGKGYGAASLTNAMKYSAGVVYTIRIPEGVTFASAAVTAMSNYKSTDAHANWGTIFGEDLSSEELPFSDGDAVTKTFLFPEGKSGTLTVQFGGNQVQAVIVFKTGIPVTITDAGYATVTPKAKVSATTGVTPNIVTVSGTTATLTPISVIPADEAVVLSGDAGTYYLPITDADASDVTGNQLISSSNPVTADGTQYVLAKGDNGVGFYKATVDTEIAAGKGYLVSPLGAPYFIFGIEGGTTGIDSVQGSEFTVNGEYYNLAGQRVAQPTKGLYIVNGKKVVVK